MRTSIDGAKAVAKPVAANTVTANRNIRETPMASMNGPATTVARLEVSRNEVITQGSRDTLPRSAAMSGNAAAIPKAWNEASAAVANTAIDAGSNSRERTLVGAADTESRLNRRHDASAGRKPFSWVNCLEEYSFGGQVLDDTDRPRSAELKSPV